MARARVAILTWLAGVLLMVSLAIVHTAPQDTAARSAADAERHLATITQYCVACHNDRTKAAGVSFQGVTAASIGEHAETWEKALRKLRGRQMPPPGSRQPDQKEIDAFVAWMETTLDAPAASAEAKVSAEAKASA